MGLKVQVQKPATGACPSGYALTEAECAGLDGQTIDGKSVKYIHGATYGNPEQCGCYFDSGNKVYFNRRTTDCTKTDAGEIGICKAQLKVQVQKPATGACPSGYALTEAECAGLNGQTIDGKSVKYIHGATYGNPEQCGCYFDSGNKVYFNRRTTDCTQ